MYRCRHKLDKNEYAVKETLKRFVGSHRVYGLNEIQALASLTAIEENTNVVRYYHSWVEDEKLYLVVSCRLLTFLTFIRWSTVPNL